MLPVRQLGWNEKLKLFTSLLSFCIFPSFSLFVSSNKSNFKLHQNTNKQQTDPQLLQWNDSVIHSANTDSVCSVCSQWRCVFSPGLLPAVSLSPLCASHPLLKPTTQPAWPPSSQQQSLSTSGPQHPAHDAGLCFSMSHITSLLV